MTDIYSSFFIQIELFNHYGGCYVMINDSKWQKSGLIILALLISIIISMKLIKLIVV